MSITPQLIKDLRERTGIGMGKCKEALVEAGGDIELAINNLRKAGMASAVKKEGRETNEGEIGVAENGDAIAVVEVNAETDFVVQNERFKEFLKNVCEEALEKKPADLASFMSSKYSKDAEMTMDEFRATTVQSLGENIQVRRLVILPKSSNSSIGVYSHMGGKIVSVVELDGVKGQEALARDIAMHAAAEAPEYLRPEDVPAEIKTREEEIGREQVKGKPENIIDKIVEGKLKAFYDQVCLLNQKYVKDNSMTIAGLLEKEAKGAELKSFIRWQVGA